MKYLTLLFSFFFLFSFCSEKQNESKQSRLDNNVSERKTIKQTDIFVKHKTDVIVKHKTDTIHKLCNISLLLILEHHLENPSDKDLNNFLETFDKSCQINVEYSEFSNELLFKVLQKYPNRMISILSKNKNIKLKYILKELHNPVHDGFDINNIINKIQMNRDIISIKIVKALKEIP